MGYDIQQIASLLEADLLNADFAPGSIDHLLIDTRQITFPDQELFFALPGIRHDGHDFLPQAYAEGVRHFVVSKNVDPALFPTANLLFVTDTLGALQQLAAFHREQFSIPVVGITGSNGKTIVKEWLNQLLWEDYAIIRSPRSFNSQIGVPLSVWQLQPNTTLALFEAGISQAGEMSTLASIIRCTLGIFTNLGEAHREGFTDEDEQLQEKLELFREASLICYCREDARVDQAITKRGIPTQSWAYQQEADLQIVSITQQVDGTTIAGIYRGRSQHIQIPFTDQVSIENAIHCWNLLLYLQLPPERIRERMQRLQPVAMRMELKEGGHQCLLLNDSYNNDLAALRIALQTQEQHALSRSRTLILSDVLQTGMSNPELYRHIAQLLVARQITRFFGVGEQVVQVRQWLPASIEQHYFPSTEALLRELSTFTFYREIILLKGARPFSFERIAQALARQAHLTTLEVNLSALAHNLRVYHRLLHPRVKMMVMVKAAAYGSGMIEIGRLLEFFRVDYLAVAYADEGVELRQAGINVPILVLNPEEAAFDRMLHYRLEPEIYSLRQFRQWLAFIDRTGNQVPIHLKLDTGMHRLGFTSAELDELISLLRQHPTVSVMSIFTHLAASDDPTHDAFTRQQLDAFTAGYTRLAQILGYAPLRHALNSSGISRFSQYQMDMVRLGIGIYGVDASRSLQEKLQPVLHLRATVSQIKTLQPGESVGYGRSGQVDRPSRIATISVGYADGFSRLAGEGRYQVSVGNYLAPTIGRICMDMCMIDITDIPEVVKEGDPVYIFGDRPSVETLALATQTIPLEVFAGISPRVKRVYLQE